MKQETVIKCSICGTIRFVSVPEFKEIVEKNLLRMCLECETKAKSIDLPYPMSKDDHSKMLTYINDIRGVKNEAS